MSNLQAVAWCVVMSIVWALVVPLGVVYIFINFIIEELWKWLRN